MGGEIVQSSFYDEDGNPVPDPIPYFYVDQDGNIVVSPDVQAEKRLRDIEDRLAVLEKRSEVMEYMREQLIKLTKDQAG